MSTNGGATLGPPVGGSSSGATVFDSGTDAVATDGGSESGAPVPTDASDPIASSDAPRVIVQLEGGHAIVLTASDLVLIATLALLASNAVVGLAEVFR